MVYALDTTLVLSRIRVVPVARLEATSTIVQDVRAVCCLVLNLDDLSDHRNLPNIHINSWSHMLRDVTDLSNLHVVDPELGIRVGL